MRNWAGNVEFAGEVVRPPSVEALRSAVAGAPRVRALGTGHSFSRVADGGGLLVRLDGLPVSVEVDSAAGTAWVSAGATYAEVAPRLHRAGVALGAMASLPHISVAGAIATGTHGSGDGVPALAAAVRGLRLLGPDGEVREVLAGEADFAGQVVSLGALGVVTQVLLAVETAFSVSQTVRVGVPLAEIDSAVFGAAYSVSAFTDWGSGTARVWLKERADRPGPGWLGGHAADGPVHPVPSMSPRACTDQSGEPGPAYERLPHFRPDLVPSAGAELQSEFLLPRTATAAAFEALAGLGGRIASALHISEVRTVAADDLWLSPCHGRDTTAFHFTWLPDPGLVLPVLAEVEAALLPLGARPHWGKLTTIDPARVAAGYERAADFGRLRRELDPGGKFGNEYVDAHFPR